MFNGAHLFSLVKTFLHQDVCTVWLLSRPLSVHVNGYDFDTRGEDWFSIDREMPHSNYEIEIEINYGQVETFTLADCENGDLRTSRTSHYRCACGDDAIRICPPPVVQKFVPTATQGDHVSVRHIDQDGLCGGLCKKSRVVELVTRVLGKACVTNFGITARELNQLGSTPYLLLPMRRYMDAKDRRSKSIEVSGYPLKELDEVWWCSEEMVDSKRMGGWRKQ